jgi:hypothetical protein
MQPENISRTTPDNGQPYPTDPSARTRWILSRRRAKNALDPTKAYHALWEEEAGTDGQPISTATLFLTNKECPFRCLMCDLWRNTLDEPVPRGAIPHQIREALASLPATRQVKLYNAGSFFDSQAIPPEDDAEIVDIVNGYERVIVEAHPAFIGRRCFEFARRIPGKLEVAIGLETCHPGSLARLNKRFTVDDFRRSATQLAEHGIDLRVFLLVGLPFLSAEESLEWACRSLDMAFDSGASVCCVIPTRPGNGALDALLAEGRFELPSVRMLEQAQEYGLSLGRGRVFADLWDIEGFHGCSCSPRRAERIAGMNRAQAVPSPIVCPRCSPRPLPLR